MFSNRRTMRHFFVLAVLVSFTPTNAQQSVESSESAAMQAELLQAIETLRENGVHVRIESKIGASSPNVVLGPTSGYSWVVNRNDLQPILFNNFLKGQDKQIDWSKLVDNRKGMMGSATGNGNQIGNLPVAFQIEFISLQQENIKLRKEKADLEQQVAELKEVSRELAKYIRQEESKK